MTNSGRTAWQVPHDDTSLREMLAKLETRNRRKSTLGMICVSLLVAAFLIAVFSNLPFWFIVVLAMTPSAIAALLDLVMFPPWVRKAIRDSVEDYLYALKDYERWTERGKPAYLDHSLYYIKHGEQALKDIPAYRELRTKIERACEGGGLA